MRPIPLSMTSSHARPLHSHHQCQGCHRFCFLPPLSLHGGVSLSSNRIECWLFFIKSLKSLPLELLWQSVQMTSKHETSGDFKHAEWCVLNNLTKDWHGFWTHYLCDNRTARHIPCHVLPQLARFFLLFCTRQFFLRSHGWVREQGNF